MKKVWLLILCCHWVLGQKSDSPPSTMAMSLGFGSQSNVSCFGGADGKASVTAATGGVSPYTYNWTPGNPVGDGTVSVTGLTAGTWTCTATDAIGNTAVRFFTITQPSALNASIFSITDASTPSSADGSITVNNPTGGTAPYKINWTPGNPPGDGTTTISSLTPGNYNCNIVDANTCIKTVSATVGVQLSLTAASQTNVSCNGISNGAASVTVLGGTTPYTFNWTPGNPIGDGTNSVTGLAAGTWTCTVTDASGATKSLSFPITQPPSIVATLLSQTNVSSINSADGKASINEPTGGTPPYTFNWTPGNPIGDGTKSVSGLTKGTWTCNILDANGCTGQKSFIILERLKLSANTQNNVTCFGASNGTASVITPTSGKAPYTYDWTPGNPNGDGSTSVSGLSPGTYTCTVSDALDSTAQVSFTITQPNELEILDFTHTNVSCPGGNNGTASILALSGGTLPYTFDWTPGNPIGDGGPSISQLTAGTWTAKVTDVNGCQAQKSLIISTDFSGQNINLISPQNDINATSESFKTTQSIVANINIQGNANVVFHSGTYVEMDGKVGVFEVKNGAVFEAKIGGCSND